MHPRRRTLLGLTLLLLVAGCVPRVSPHVALPQVQLGDAAFFPTLEAYTATPIVGGNRLDVLLNGDEIFPAILSAIRSAERTITYAQYYWEDGPVALEIAEALAERCRAGVGVSVLLDAFGTVSMPAEHVEVMKHSGCHVALYRPLTPLNWWRANYRNHRRILVVDGLIGFTGGSGVSRKWMGNGRIENHWRDTDVRLQGPAVAYLQGAFAENWLESTGIVLGGDAYYPRPRLERGAAYVQVVRSSPAGGSFAMYTMFLLAISAARRSIMISNPYFVPDARMANVITEAVKRGVQVTVLVPGAIDHNLVRQASRGKFGQMLKAGVEFYEYQPALLHAKTMVVDGVWATVGSTNLDNRSFALNDELNVVVYNREIARRLEEVFAADIKVSRKVEYRRWSRRGIIDRFLELLTLPIREQL